MGIVSGTFEGEKVINDKIGILVVKADNTGDAACYFTDVYHVVDIRSDDRYSVAISGTKITITTSVSGPCRYKYFCL